MLQESLDQLHLEVGELLASRKRLVLAADADRRRIERDFLGIRNFTNVCDDNAVNCTIGRDRNAIYDPVDRIA